MVQRTHQDEKIAGLHRSSPAHRRVASISIQETGLNLELQSETDLALSVVDIRTFTGDLAEVAVAHVVVRTIEYAFG